MPERTPPTFSENYMRLIMRQRAAAELLERWNPRMPDMEDKPTADQTHPVRAWYAIDLDGNTYATPNAGTAEDWKRYGRTVIEMTPKAATCAPSGYTAVPDKVIAWLMGEGPDDRGFGFGDAPQEARGAHGWRTIFRRMMTPRTPPPGPKK